MARSKLPLHDGASETSIKKRLKIFMVSARWRLQDFYRFSDGFETEGTENVFTAC